MEETIDYEIFKAHNRNRPLDEGNIKKIVNSIKIKNLMHLRPILVNNSMEIIDGQHRLEACKRLKVPVFYEIQKGIGVEEIILLNSNQKSWKVNDYIQSYAKGGHQHYCELVKFANENELAPETAFRLLYPFSSSQRSRTVRDGSFKMPDSSSDLYIKIQKSLACYKECMDIMRVKILGPKIFLGQKKFRQVLLEFLSSSNVDKSIFVSKIVLRIDVIGSRMSTVGYHKMWKEIYNFRNQDPLPD